MDNPRSPRSLDDALVAALADSHRAPERDGVSGERDDDPDDPSPESEGKRAAVREILARAGSRSLTALVNALRSDDGEVVAAATIALGDARDPAAVPELVRLLRHPDVNIAQAAVDALGKLRAQSAAPHIEGLLEADPWVRFAAVHALGEIGHPGSVHALLRAAGDAALSELAIEALGKLATVPAATILAELLYARAESDGFDGCLLALGTALARMVDHTGLDNSRPWQRLASSEAKAVHARLVSLLVRRDVEPERAVDRHFLKEAAVTLIRALALPHLYPALVEAAWDLAIGELLLDAVLFAGESVHPFVLEGLFSPDADVRVFCATAAAALGLEEAVDACERLLGPGELRVRVAALRALAALGSEHALPAMVRCLADPAESMWNAAVRALTALDANRVTVALLAEPRLAEDHTARVLEVMRGTPCAAQQPFVVDALVDPRAEVRRAAVAVLAARDSAEGQEMLEPLLRDPSVEVRAEVIHALGRRATRRARELLLSAFERDADNRDNVLRALGRIGDGQAARRLIASYARHDLATRLAIVDALGGMAVPVAEPFLAYLLHAPQPELRCRAVVAIGAYTSEGAVTRLVQATRDADARVRVAALESLSAFTARPLAVEAFERLCLDPVPAIASLARRCLRKTT